MIKSYTNIFSVILILCSCHALTVNAAPGTIVYRGRLLDSTGNVVDSSTARVNVKIYSDLTGGNLLYEDDNAGVTVAGGMYRVVVGDDASAHGATYTSLTDALGADDSVYLEIEIDDDGAGGMTALTPREQLLSAPFAIGSDVGVATVLSDADGDTKVQVEETPDDDTIRFDTSGVQRMVIAPDGEVGIATGTPVSGLDIQTSIGRGIATKTSSYSLTVTDNVVLVDASSNPVTITLPPAAGIAGREYVIKAVDVSNPAYIAASGADLIDGGSVIALENRYDLVGVVTDGDDWYVSYFMNGADSRSIDTGDGADGALVVSAAGTVINDYARLTGNEAAGSMTITVNSSSGFSAGDEILIHQTQDDANGVAGIYEFAEIAAVDGNDLGLTAGIRNDYYSGTFDALAAEVAQVVRVPNHTSVTINNGASITADAWDGYDGGIVVFRANGTVSFTGTAQIDVAERGFRGGDDNGGGNNSPGDPGEGYKGKGWSNDPTTANCDPNGNGGGGGYGPSGYNGTGGGGGGNKTAGENATEDRSPPAIAQGGEAVGDAAMSRIFLGGGGGGGGDDDGWTTPGPYGGDGGGIVMVFAKTISGASIDASGEDGISGARTSAGDGGGGAGGGVWLRAGSLTVDSMDVSGGAGGADGGGDEGGDGGDGWYEN